MNLFCGFFSVLRLGGYPSKLGLIAIFLWIFSISHSAAQDEESDEIFVLNPFTVDASEDVGYRSTNSTSGTSLNTPLKELPMSIEVINADFIEDIGATDFDESLKYSSGLFTDRFIENTSSGETSNGPGANEVGSGDRSPSSSGGLGGRFDNGVTIRGFPTTTQNREGFRYGGLIANTGTSLGGVIDTSNVSRMEVVRGPNSLLYGVGVLSGIVNVIAKRPLSVQAKEFSLTMGSYDFKRATWDFTGPVTEFWNGELNYRVIGAREERGDWTDFYKKDMVYYAGQLEFKNDSWNAFLEVQHLDRKDNGIGPRHIHDNTAASDLGTNRNQYGEQWNWQREGLTILPNGEPELDENGFFTHNVDMGEGFRITGPDTYDRRRETTVMATLSWSPSEAFTIDAGAMFSDAEEERFDMAITTVNNDDAGAVGGTSGAFLLKRDLNNRGEGSNSSPEVIAETEAFRAKYVRREVYGFVDEDSALDYDDRLVRYWWRKRPEDAVTEQYRIRMRYEFETDDFFGNLPAKHLFLLGRHDIKDDVDVIRGNETIERQFWSTAGRQEVFRDPVGSILKFRRIDDQTPIRFDPFTDYLAVPGNRYENLEVWNSGHFGMYQGSYWNQRLSFIAGLRHDRYHSRQQRYDRFEEAVFNPANPLDRGPAGQPFINPDNETFGFLPFPDDALDTNTYRPGPEAEKTWSETLAVSFRVTDDITFHALRAEGIFPNTGITDGNNQGIPSEEAVSEELGIKFELFDRKLSGGIAVYRITRENAVYSLLGAPRPIAWFGGDSPNPSNPETDQTTFVPELKHFIGDGFFSDESNDGRTFISHGINREYFLQEGVDIGPFAPPGTRNKRLPEGVVGQGIFGGGATVLNYLDHSKLDKPVFNRDGEMVIRNGQPLTWRYFAEKAFADRTNMPRNGEVDSQNFWPFFNSRLQGAVAGNNIDAGQGQNSRANVTYTDEATGVDLNMIWQPNPNLQFVLSYAHTEREVVSPFDLVDNIDPVTGEWHGTEYDAMVRVLGREAFGLVEERDADGNVIAVTKDGQIIKNGDVRTSDLTEPVEGIELYDGSEDSGSILAKYTFTEGKLDRLAVTLGAVYRGPARTSFEIGGFNLEGNRFGTPPTPEQLTINFGMSYSIPGEKVTHRFRLNVNNVTDEFYDFNIATYDDDGTPVQRITEVYRTPQEVRASWNISF